MKDRREVLGRSQRKGRSEVFRDGDSNENETDWLGRSQRKWRSEVFRDDDSNENETD